MIKERLEWLNSYIENSIWKKSDLARTIGVSPVSVRDLLLYGRKAINKEKFLEFCSVLNLNPDFFYLNEVIMPFLPHTLYKLRIKEIVDFVDIFGFFKEFRMLGLSLILSNEVYFLLLKFYEFDNILFLIAKKRLIGLKNQTFGNLSKTYNHIALISEKINLKFFTGVTIEPKFFLTYKRDFVNEFFDKCDYKDCEPYFHTQITVTLTSHELELLYYLRKQGVTTKDQFIEKFVRK